MSENTKYRIFLYKRGHGCVKNFACPSNRAVKVAKELLAKYDGALVLDGKGIMKAMYGYCGG